MSPPSEPPRRTFAADPFIFGVSAAVVAVALALSLVRPRLASDVFLGLQDAIVTHCGWLLNATVCALLVFCAVVAASRAGRVRLGPDGVEPEFGRGTWLAMLFSAGMGIGLLFYGVAEPVLHYAAPPDAAPETRAAARAALEITLFHWGLHAWAIYAAFGLCLAYTHHRLGRPLAVRWALEPLLGRFTERFAGKAIDVLAVFGTIFGLATSLGLGATQINAGLARLVGLEQGLGAQVAIIALVTACATVSLVTGLARGIRRLSELNVLLAGALLLFVLAAGPTSALLTTLPERAGGYLAALLPLSLGSGLGDLGWQKSWTLFYWAWWISWAPFVGTFVARISRGRTIREFVVAVLFVPTGVTLLWFQVFGGAALQSELAGPGGIVAAVDANVATAIFALLEQLPVPTLTAALAVAVVVMFFVTSSDSGSYVVDVLTSGGHPNPPVWQRVFWAVAEGGVAATLLFAGGLAALQSASINTGLPFGLVILAACGCLAVQLRREPGARNGAG